MCVCFSCEWPDKIIHAGLCVSSQTQSLVRGWKILSRTLLISDRLLEPPPPSLLTWQGVSIATGIFLLFVCVCLCLCEWKRSHTYRQFLCTLVGATAGACKPLKRLVILLSPLKLLYVCVCACRLSVCQHAHTQLRATATLCYSPWGFTLCWWRAVSVGGEQKIEQHIMLLDLPFCVFIEHHLLTLEC